MPLTPRLRDALRDHSADYRLVTYRGKRTPWVFHHTRRRRGAQPGQRIDSLRRTFRSACNRAKLPRTFVQHDLRHGRVTKWLAEEKSPALVKEAVGALGSADYHELHASGERASAGAGGWLGNGSKGIEALRVTSPLGAATPRPASRGLGCVPAKRPETGSEGCFAASATYLSLAGAPP